MELNRNHYFAFGIVLLLFGAQFRMIDTVVLNEKASRMVERRFGNSQAASAAPMSTWLASSVGVGPTRHSFNPPDWIGWLLLSAGAVLVLHSLALKKPGG